MKKILKRTFPEWTVWLALLGLCVVAFGLLLPFLGYYWDDWAKILVSRVFGLSGYWAYYAEDRPLSGWTHILLTPILGARPLAWHIFTLVMRWLTGVGVWWSLGQLWPQTRRQAALVAAVFMIHPVFTQQAVGLTFHQQWLQYALFFLSLGAMIQAVRQPKRRLALTLLALTASALQLTVTEYFVGLELIRPVVLFFLLGQQTSRKREQLVSTLKHYLPYLVLVALYVLWRLFFIQLSGDDPYRAETLYGFFSDPLGTIGYLARTFVTDSIQIFAWPRLGDLAILSDATRFYWMALAVGFLVFVAAALYFNRLQSAQPASEDEHARWLREALVLGLLAFLFGMIPAWITGREVLEDFHGNRYALPAMFGVSLLVVVTVEWFIRRRLQVSIAIGLLVGIAVSMHLLVNNNYRWIWTSQTRFYWQLAWRAPYIEAPTAILTENELFPNQGLFSTSAALNLLYPQPENRGENLAYWMYTLLPRFANNVPDPLVVGFKTRFRTLSFEGSTPGSLVIYNEPSRANCLWVLGPADRQNPDISELMRSFIPVSNLDRIDAQAVAAGYPPEDMFGPEPEHDWCYLFEKAELANQSGEWERTITLGEKALESGYTPRRSSSNSPREWLPFIEAFARGGQMEQARRLTEEAMDGGERYRPMMCSLWRAVDADVSTDESDEMLKNLGCSDGELNLSAGPD